MRPRLAIVVFLAGCLAASHDLAAATIDVSGNAPRTSISVSIKDAKIVAVLRELQSRFGFEIVGLENAAEGDALSMTVSGSLSSVLERLLRNRNHMLVRSPDSPSGIAKVMILDTQYGAAPDRAPVGHANDYFSDGTDSPGA
jgi:hypothetical protein